MEHPRIIVVSTMMKLVSCFVSLCLFNHSYADKYTSVAMPVSWSLAESICLQSDAMLIPDMVDEIENSDLYNILPVDEFVWINAKSLEIRYSRTSLNIKYAYKPVTSKLKFFICRDAEQFTTTRKTVETLTTWNNARQVCEDDNCDLLAVSTPKYVRRIVSLLDNGQATWVNKNLGYRLPESVVESFHGECMGMVKHDDGSVSLHVDHCDHKHTYVCANDRDDYAPALTKLSMPLTMYVHPPPPETSTAESNDNHTVTDDILSFNNSRSSALADSDELSVGALVGIIVGAVIVLLVLLMSLGFVYYRKRWLSRQAYKNSLRNYTRRQNSRRIATGTFSSRDTLKSVNSTQNEVGEKYAGDECRDLDRYISGPVTGTSPTLYQSNQGYQFMMGKTQLQSYEGFDPDLGHLQQIHGYVNTPKTDRPNGEQYDVAEKGRVPILPTKMKKKKKKQPLDDRDTYEMPSKAADEQVHLDDLDQYENEELGKNDQNKDNSYEKTAKSLDELDSYENYQRPQRRERGNYRITNNVRNQAVISPKSRNMSKNNTDYSMAKTLEELDSYENLDSPHTKHKERQAYVDDENYYDM